MSSTPDSNILAETRAASFVDGNETTENNNNDPDRLIKNFEQLAVKGSSKPASHKQWATSPFNDFTYSSAISNDQDSYRMTKSCLSPSEFFSLQSVRSSTSARKTSTASRFQRSNDCSTSLLADLHNSRNGKSSGSSSSQNGESSRSTNGSNEDRSSSRESREYEERAKSSELLSDNKFGKDESTGLSEADENPQDDELISRGPVKRVLQKSSAYGAPYPQLQQRHLTRVPEQHEEGVKELGDYLSEFVIDNSKEYRSDETKKLYEEICKSKQANQTENANGNGFASPQPAASTQHPSPGTPVAGYSSGSSTSSVCNGCPQQACVKYPAKERLKSMINEDDYAYGFHWAVTRGYHQPGVSQWKDGDGDTMLHILVVHSDYGKILGLTEQMKKMADPNKPLEFDEPNNYNETPLFIAVMFRQTEIVAYLLEHGANPNIQTYRFDRDTVLHYAASRGMTEIVEHLAAHPNIRIDDRNGLSLTALHCAIRYHGNVDEWTNQKIDNLGIIKTLIRAGADPFRKDQTNGRTIIHSTVEKMDVDLLDALREILDDDMFTNLANHVDYNGESPVDLLALKANQAYNVVDMNIREELYMLLLISGAVSGKSPSPSTSVSSSTQYSQ